MEIALTWMPLLLAALTVAAVVVVAIVLLRRRLNAGSAAPVAHTERLTALPGYARLLARYRLLLAALAVVVLTAGGASAVLASRPVTTAIVNPDRFNRDIVLCLDVSGSMVDYDAQLIAQFESLAQQFGGERISLVLWDSSSVQIFPLTDDYAYLSGQLALVRESMERDPEDYDGYNYWNGTYIAEGASLIGDGLASCVLRFDRVDSERSRSIVLATDNLVNGESIVSLAEAADFATERGVRVYGINPAEFYAPVEAAELQDAVETTGGDYFTIDDPNVVPRIVGQVLAEQATHFDSAPELVYSDQPALPLGIAVIAFLLLLVIAWRVRL